MGTIVVSNEDYVLCASKLPSVQLFTVTLTNEADWVYNSIRFFEFFEFITIH